MTHDAKSKKPTRKVRIGGIAGLITAGGVTAVAALFHIGVSKPVAVLIAAVLVAGIHFAAAYQARSGA